jgi:hypothetical protein
MEGTRRLLSISLGEKSRIHPGQKVQIDGGLFYFPVKFEWSYCEPGKELATNC